MTMLPAVHDVIDGLEVFICGLDNAGKILVFNRPCEQLTGFSRDAALGKNWLDVFAIRERHDHVLALWDAATTGQATRPYEALCRTGRSLRWQFSRQSSTYAPPVKLWAVGIDITEEREALARARETERMVSFGNLVAGLTHELRNPLNGALLQLALAERHEARSNGPSSTADAIVKATTEIRRISTLLDDFLVFVRPLPVHLERFDVRLLVERAIERGEPKSLSAAVTIALEPGEETGAEVDVTRVEAAVFHLLANAIDAAADAPDHAVRVRVETLENTVVIEVEDHGAGIPAEGDGIFEPFFTTKGGTGLGLAIVERVAADHAGKIAYERRDHATVFRLELPIVGGARH